MAKRILIGFFLFVFARLEAVAQCGPFSKTPLSDRTASYEIDATLDDAKNFIVAEQVVHFKNPSPESVASLRFYLYFNAFKNTESTFLRGAANIFGQRFDDRKAEEWGWVEVEKFVQEVSVLPKKGEGAAIDLTSKMRFVQPDDGNPNDQTVLEIPLERPVAAGETATFRLKWKAQIPRTIARAGHSRNFFFMCHWFPQLGVFEKKTSGAWAWNCHQFMRMTEFFADFGTYDVRIRAQKGFVMGASGCLVSEKDHGDGTSTRHFRAEDVIDFAWTAYPRFRVFEDKWRDVQIRILAPPEHAAMAPRYLFALKFALEYLDQHVGKYPYPSITVVDPPFHGLRSGLMEYPTLVTAGTFYAMPRGVRTSESLVVHEFVHQYFMAMVASNEKEEPWLDEGFVTYFEDRIIDAAFGEKRALVDVFGYRFGSREQSRLEYTAMRNPREIAPANPAWAFSESNRKALIYSKTATTLHTVERLVGQKKMDEIVSSYFEKWKFKHPRGADFLAVLREKMGEQKDSIFGLQVFGLFEKGVFGTAVLDYAVTEISNDETLAEQGVFGQKQAEFIEKDGKGPRQTLSTIEVQRLGDFVFPVELKVVFEDGSSQILNWSGDEGVKIFEFRGGPKIVSAQIDPDSKLALDIDQNNNSRTLQPVAAPGWKWAAKATFWAQNLFQLLSFLT